MKLLEKNGLNYLTGMFWQIPDEGKRSLNISKLIKETKMNFSCKTKKIKPTFGFCTKDDIGDKKKKVASLAQYIVECSNVSAGTPDSIICFKFKDAGELDEIKQPLEQALYGYVVFMNGTICPDDGEYVSDITMLRIAILKKLKKHDIKILHLPFDVVTELLNIYEQLSVSFEDDETLLSLIFNSSFKNIEPLIELIKSDPLLEQKFNGLFKSRAKIRFQTIEDSFDEKEFEERNAETGLIEHYQQYVPYTQYVGKSEEAMTIRRLIKEPKFIQEMTNTRQTRDDLTIIAEQIYAFPINSDEIYWNNPKLKSNYARSLIKPLNSFKGKAIRHGVLAGVLLAAGVTANYLTSKPDIVDDNSVEEAKPIVPTAVSPEQLIKACIISNDKYFGANGFVLKSIKCNSMGLTLTFDIPDNTTLSDFIAFAGGNKSALLNGKVGTINKQFLLQPGLTKLVARDVVISKLQNAALNYSMTVSLPTDATTKTFTINSKLSPVFLFNHGILSNVKLSDISMALDATTGSYNWTIQGEI